MSAKSGLGVGWRPPKVPPLSLANTLSEGGLDKTEAFFHHVPHIVIVGFGAPT